MPSGGYDDSNNPGTGGSGSGSSTDWGGIVDDIGGLCDGLFDGNFWDFINDIGCLSSDFRRKFLETRFPENVDKMRQLSGVATATTNVNVNNFSLRLHHAKMAMEHVRDDVGGCRHKYFKLYAEMFTDYITAFKSLMTTQGFVSSGTAVQSNFNQSDVLGYDGYDLTFNVTYPVFNYDSSHDTNPYDYGTIGGSNTGGGIFGGSQYLPTMNNTSVFNWALGAGLAFMGFVWLRDTGNLKEIGINKKRK